MKWVWEDAISSGREKVERGWMGKEAKGSASDE